MFHLHLVCPCWYIEMCDIAADMKSYGVVVWELRPGRPGFRSLLSHEASGVTLH